MKKISSYLEEIQIGHVRYILIAIITIMVGLYFLYFSYSARTSSEISGLKKNIQELENQIPDKVNAFLIENTDKVIANKLESFSSQLTTLQEKINKEKEEYNKIKLEKERAFSNLPEYVGLDELAKSYEEKLKQSNYSFDTIVAFNTLQGEINFLKENIKLAYLQDSHQIVSIRIGEEQSNKDPEIIAAWIDDDLPPIN